LGVILNLRNISRCVVFDSLSFLFISNAYFLFDLL
jgi:hypothetical protein